MAYRDESEEEGKQCVQGVGCNFADAASLEVVCFPYIGFEFVPPTVCGCEQGWFFFVFVWSHFDGSCPELGMFFFFLGTWFKKGYR